jgi:gluconolactonase
VFCRTTGGDLKLVAKELTGPNGLAFSPDEKFLYVDNWDEHRRIVTRYEVRPDGSLASGAVFADLTSEPGEEAFDGLKVDRAGNVFVSGPGGVWIFSPIGRRIGLVKLPVLPANFAWGSNGASLYIAARSDLYRLSLRQVAASAPR